jgi:hypothetical protein
MSSLHSPYLDRVLPNTLVAVLTAAGSVLVSVNAWADTPGFSSSPVDLSARVQDIHNPGGTVFDDHHDVGGAFAVPKQSAEYMYHAPVGLNISGRSRNIQSAFASALAESDGNGGVGVSSWIAFDAVPGTRANDALVAQAQWNESFTYLGSAGVQVNFHFSIPAITVGLIGVAPNRDSPSKTERAFALVTLTSFVVHGDGSRTEAGGFELGLSADEYQIQLSPRTYANYTDVTLTNTNFPASIPLTLTQPNDPYNPEWILDPVSGDRTLATLSYGDALVYQYTLAATGHTRGGERGYYAFIGDPSGIEVIGGNLVVSARPVPEPGTATLMLAGLAAIGLGRCVRSRATASQLRPTPYPS